MADYDFSALSPTDFEELCRDLLQRRLGVELQSFTKGRDGGVDLRHAPVPDKTWVVQCKHFSGSTFSKLKSKLKNDELPKLARLKPERYILATSLGLTPRRVDELHSLLQPHCKSVHDIISKDDLNGLIRDHPEVERSHFKLWVTSEPVLSRVLQNDIFIQSAMTKEEIRRRLGLYVHTDAFERARKKLERERVCILSGVPGVGKTTLAEMLLVEYMMKEWQLVSIHQNVSEGLRAFQENPKSKQVFYYDDFLGQISSGEKLAKNEDRVLLQLMNSVAATPRKRFILTTREYILAQAKAEHEQLARAEIDIYRFVVNCEEYSEFEKAQILANHLFFFGVPQSHIESLIDGSHYRRIISHTNYSPRIIEWMTGKSETAACKPKDYPKVFISGLDNPSKLWSHAFTKQISDASRHLLLSLATCGDSVFMDEFQPIFEGFYSKRTHELGISRSSTDFNDSLNELEGNFVKIHASDSRRVIQFHNPSILDFLKAELRRRPQEITDLLRTARSFDQVERIALVFDLGFGASPNVTLDDKDACVLREAIEATIEEPSIGVSLADGTERKWNRKLRNQWERLRDCVRIGNRFRNPTIGECIVRLLNQRFDNLDDESGVIEELVSVVSKVSMVPWCSHSEATHLQKRITEYLLERRDDFEETLDGLVVAATWVKESSSEIPDAERDMLLESLTEAVTKTAEEESQETDPQRLGGSLAVIQELSEILETDFEQEERWLNEALSECGPGPDEETPEDWRSHREADACQSSIESLFDSLLQ